MNTNQIITILLINIFAFGLSQKNENLPTKPQLAENGEVTENKKKFIRLYFEAEKNKLLEDYGEAIVKYEKCTSLIPEESAPYYQIAKIYLYVFQELDDADYYIKEAIKLSSENKWYYYEQLSIYRAQNNLEEELNTYYKLIEIDKYNELYYLEVIRILKDLKK